MGYEAQGGDLGRAIDKLVKDLAELASRVEKLEKKSP
jgi:hypothetical protein